MIKNIIFDVGDVLIEYRWHQMLMDYGLDKDEAYRLGITIFEDPLWHELDMAIMDREEVIKSYREKYVKYADTIEWFINHGEYMHVQRKDVYKLIHKLKEKGYKIYLLSNYCEDLFIKHTNGAEFLKDIDGKVVSYEVKITKPDERIYEYLLKKYSLERKECIFFDDREENVIKARELGIESFLVKSKESLIEKINELLNIEEG